MPARDFYIQAFLSALAGSANRLAADRALDPKGAFDNDNRIVGCAEDIAYSATATLFGEGVADRVQESFKKA